MLDFIIGPRNQHLAGAAGGREDVTLPPVYGHADSEGIVIKLMRITVAVLLACSGLAIAQDTPAGAQKEAPATYLSADFEAGFPADLSNHHMACDGGLACPTACQVLEAGAKTANGNVATAHSGTHVLVCSTTGAGGPKSNATNRVDLYFGPETCDLGSGPSRRVGVTKMCNPAAAAPPLIASWWEFEPQSSISNVIGGGLGGLSQQKFFLARYTNSPGKLLPAWWMISYSAALKHVLAVEDAGSDAPPGIGTFDTGIPVHKFGGVWRQFVARFEHDTATGCGHAKLWMRTDDTPLELVADTDTRKPASGCYKGFGTSEMAAQQQLQFGLVYVQGAAGGVDVFVDDICVANSFEACGLK